MTDKLIPPFVPFDASIRPMTADERARGMRGGPDATYVHMRERVNADIAEACGVPGALMTAGELPAAAAARAAGDFKKASALSFLHARIDGGRRTIYLVKRSRSRTGHTEVQQAFWIFDGELEAIGLHVANALGLPYDQKTDGGGVVFRGSNGSREMRRLGDALGIADLDWEWL